MSVVPCPSTKVASPKARRRDGPDFICVGLMKGGTQWLYDQLQHHPDFWMTPHKELHYFDRDFPGAKIRAAAAQMLASPETVETWRAELDYRPIDERDAPFFEKVVGFDGPEKDFDFYASLFEPAGELLSGDITPAYSTLRNALVKKIAARFDQARVILLLRDPVERLWSQWSMWNIDREKPEGHAYDLEAFRSWAARDGVVARSYPTKIARRWRRHFGDRYAFFFLDDVATRPDETRAAILEFIGARPIEPAQLPAGFNRKERQISFERTPEIRALMKTLFADERKACAHMFGGAALAWPDAPY